MLIVTDPENPQPIYLQIAQQVIDQVSSGQIEHGERLPSAAVLAGSLGLNRNTVLQAYRHLRDQGYLDLRRGRGALARSPSCESDPVQPAVDHLVSVATARGKSLKAVTDLLSRGGLT